MPHDASQISRWRDQTQMIVIGHQTLGEDFDTQGYGSCAVHEKGLVTAGGPGGRLASQTTAHHIIECTLCNQDRGADTHEQPNTSHINQENSQQQT